MHSHTTELLPCPFCNGTPELRETGGWSGIGCNTNKCPAYLHALMFRTPAEAIAAWNRRSYATALCQQGERDAKDAALADGFDGSAIRPGWNHTTILLWYDTEEKARAAHRVIVGLVDTALSASKGKTEQQQGWQS